MKIIFLFFFITGSLFAMEVDKHKITLEKIEDYQFCHANKYPPAYCQNALERWVESHPNDIIKAAKLTRKNMISWGAMEFFYKGKGHKDFTCNDEDLFLAIKSAYGLPLSNKEVISKAKELAFKNCPKEIPGKLVQDLSAKSANFQFLCGDFKEAGLLQGLKKMKCK